MPSIKTILLMSFIAMLGFSCKWDKKTVATNENHTASIAIVMDSIYKSGPDVITNGDTSSSYVLLKFPKSMGLGSVDQLIIKTIKESQFESISGALFLEENDPKPATVLDAIDKFIKSSEVDGNDNVFMGYFYESIVDTNFVGNDVISIAISDFYFTGGAHPNSFTNYLNFDRATGAKIDINSIIQDTNAMKVVVEKAFYESEKKELGNEYDAKSYFFDDGFSLPQNYAITSKGLQCLYNPYEAAAYARGPILFTIPWKDLNGIIAKYVPLDGIKLGDDLQ